MSKSTERNRLMLEIDQAIKEINCEVINPEIPEISMKDLEPVFYLIARTRTIYLKELFDISKITDEIPSKDQIERLAKLRASYEEMVSASQALLTAVERGYLDIIDTD